MLYILGDTLDTYGTGNFTFGCFGGVTLAPPARAGVDAATGLLYVGNGQYGVYLEPVERIQIQEDS